MKTKRKYERPQMEVVELRQRGMLMTSGDATLNVQYEEEDW